MQTNQLLGKTVSHYKITEFLGGGGMGIVYKAEDLKLKRTVALKFLPTDLTRDADIKERFMHEAQAASALDHPRIGTIYEIDETDDGSIFIAMAYYDGVTLKTKIEAGVSLIEAVEIAMQVAGGLSKTHQQGIVHRDIKPANVMITNDGFVKIVDFGLAKLSGGTKLTKTGTTMGTPSYMSPEQVKGLGVDHRTDIWALGVILYEMATGELPFKGDHEMAVLYNIVNVDPEPSPRINPKVPANLERIINKALQKAAADRYSSMNDLLKELSGVRAKLLSGSTASNETVLLETTPSITPPPTVASRTKTIVVDRQKPPVAKTVKKKIVPPDPSRKKSNSKFFIWTAALLVLAGAAWLGYNQFKPIYGYVNVDSNPRGAAIKLDDQPTSQSTPATVGPLKTGEHKITIELKGYESASTSLNLSNADTLSKILELVALKPPTGNLSVKSQPAGAKIVINNNAVEQTTPAEFTNLAVGKYRIVVEKEGYVGAQQIIDLTEGETAKVDLMLEPVVAKVTQSTQTQKLAPKPEAKSESTAETPGNEPPKTEQMATLTVTAIVLENGMETPGIAEIYIDGQKVGQTPLTNYQLKSGAHTVNGRMFNHLLQGGPQNITLTPGEKSKLRFKFEKL